MEEPLLDRSVVAIADRGDHVAAIVAQVLGRLLAHDVPLVRDQGDEGDQRGADDCADGPAREPFLADKEVEGLSQVHELPIKGSIYQGVPNVFSARRNGVA